MGEGSISEDRQDWGVDRGELATSLYLAFMHIVRDLDFLLKLEYNESVLIDAEACYGQHLGVGCN